MCRQEMEERSRASRTSPLLLGRGLYVEPGWREGREVCVCVIAVRYGCAHGAAQWIDQWCSSSSIVSLTSHMVCHTTVHVSTFTIETCSITFVCIPLQTRMEAGSRYTALITHTSHSIVYVLIKPVNRYTAFVRLRDS